MSFDFPHRRRIEKRMADHQDQAFSVSNLDQFFTFRGGGGHRLFDEGVFAGQQACLGEWKVVLDRGGNHNRIQPRYSNHLPKVFHRLGSWIQGAEVLQAPLVYITHCPHTTIRERVEITNQIRPPVAASNYA